MCNSFSPGFPKLLESVIVNIGMPVVQAVGRSVYGHVITKLSRMGSLPDFLTHGAPQVRLAHQSSAMTFSFIGIPGFPGVQMWTKEHVILLCREVLSVNPFSAKNKFQ